MCLSNTTGMADVSLFNFALFIEDVFNLFETGYG